MRTIPTCVGAQLRPPVLVELEAVRTIPTCVGTQLPSSVCGCGTTSPRAWEHHRTDARRPDHPHVRGERGYPAPADHPHVRGSTRSHSVGAAPQDHPHVRGRARVGRVVRVSVGPSPRAWGAHWPGVCKQPHYRTIPTCVGARTVPGRLLRSRSYGPSPRAWGAQKPWRGGRPPLDHPDAWGALP